ncbi:MAG: penicillin-binding protein activator [Candidatus Berkiellales bacterium]
MKKNSLSAFLAIFMFLLNGCKTTDVVQADDHATEIAATQSQNELEEPNFHSPAFAHSGQPNKIALLLPFSGKHAEAATALREGFLATHYNGHSQHKPNIQIYDTTKSQNIQSLYQTALNEGADFVVGPLSKEDVEQLSQLPPSQMGSPILALNHLSSGRDSPSHFIQFSLSPESEAKQLAHYAWGKGFKTASVIVPDNAWGKRIASTFNEQWQSLGGRVLQTVHANPSKDQAAAVRKLLGIDESQKRANDIEKLISEKVELKARRQQDMDVIIMAAPPEQARQLKPLFDFYYAENVPVYATSSVYSGHPSRKRDRDINGVVFCDMPWLLEQQRGDEIQQLLGQRDSTYNDQFKRLFAMGVDAYHLTNRLQQLQSGTMYAGATGNLTLENNNHLIHRDLVWAQIKDGVPVRVN